MKTSVINLEALRIYCAKKQINETNFKNFLIKTIENIIISKIDPEATIRIDFPTPNTFLIFNQNKEVISDEDYAKYVETDNLTDVSFIGISDAKNKINNPLIKIGDLVEDIVPFSLIKPYANKIISDLKKTITLVFSENVISYYQPLIGSVIKVKVDSQVKNGYILVDYNAPIEAKILLSNHEMKNPNQKLELNKDIKIYVKNLEKDKNKFGETIVVASEISDVIIRDVLKKEIPEIANNELEIFAIARNLTLKKTKVAIKKAPNSLLSVDEIGSVLGKKASRINSVIKEMEGEQIEIVRYDEDLLKFAINVLAPARVISCFFNKSFEEAKISVIVPDSQLSLAIGKQGYNVKLASQLIKEKIKVMPYSEAQKLGMDINWNGNISLEELKNLQNYHKNKNLYHHNSYVKKPEISFDNEEFTKLLEEYKHNLEKDLENSNIDFSFSGKEKTSRVKTVKEVFEEVKKPATKISKPEKKLTNPAANLSVDENIDSFISNSFNESANILAAKKSRKSGFELELKSVKKEEKNLKKPTVSKPKYVNNIKVDDYLDKDLAQYGLKGNKQNILDSLSDDEWDD